MKIEPSDSLEPPAVEISEEFDSWLNSLNNWQLIGLETMVVWMKSSICACSVVCNNFNNHSDKFRPNRYPDCSIP